jgi:hypothetical protein
LPKYGGLGAFGIQGLQANVESTTLRSADQPYEFQRGTIYNLESSDFIRHGSGASGAHSDIDGPEVAHAVWQAALVSEE